MFAHHIITFFLLTLSYSTNFTRVGNLVLSQMDLVDIVLPVRNSLSLIALSR